MHRLSIAIILILTIAATAASGQVAVRVKDLAHVDGVRSNQLVGYGLVVGLNNTGDSQQTLFTMQSVANLLQAFGVSSDGTKLVVRNVAAVMVTADLPAFCRPGDKIDVVVSSMGDATTLQGGTLLQSPLVAANGKVYAVAQGPISIGGFTAGGGGSSVKQNHATVGRVPHGAIVEKATETTVTVNDTLDFSLDDQDFTTASRIAEAINDKYGVGVASATDAANVAVKVPADQRSQVVDLISDIGDLSIEPDATAKVVVDERTGTVAIGGSVRLSPIAISHGNLTVEINKDYLVSQPEPLTNGKTVVASPKKVSTTEDRASLVLLHPSTIDDLVKALNALKVTPRDIIAILQTIKQAGALHGELEVL